MTGTVGLTLPGAPVTREVTWDMVRAYLRAEGWQDRGIDSDLWETWTRGVAALRFGDGEAAMSRIVSELADPANVSPGEMLARIADSNLSPEEDERRRLLGMDREPPDVPRCCRCATRHPTGTKCYGAP